MSDPSGKVDISVPADVITRCVAVVSARAGVPVEPRAATQQAMETGLAVLGDLKAVSELAEPMNAILRCVERHYGRAVASSIVAEAFAQALGEHPAPPGAH